MPSAYPTYKGDLHIHTQLSPCGSLDNSPANIIQYAQKAGLDFIAVADHNTTRQAKLVVELGKKAGLTVFPGVEVNTKEEVHCLAIFPDVEPLERMQEILNDHLPQIQNNPEYFGFQVEVDDAENIVYTEDIFLHGALDLSIDQLCDIVHQLGGIFIPAHIDRRGNSLLRQLGFIPPTLPFDALEIFRSTNPDELRAWHAIPPKVTLLKNSDAHYPEDICRAYSEYFMPDLSFNNLRDALHGKNGCGVVPYYSGPKS